MVEIGNMPIIWHIMKFYASYGIKEFILCVGYKGNLIKEFFHNYNLHTSDLTINLKNNTKKFYKNKKDDWKITIIDTGLETQTGGRIKKIKKYVEKDEFFLMTYGDGLSDVNIKKLIKYHRKKNKMATLTAVYPSPRFGVLDINNGLVNSFKEKVIRKGLRINGGFFVLKPDIFKYIKNSHSIWETEVMLNLVKNKELAAYEHNSFWEPMDTIRDMNYLNNLWKNKKAPWKLW